MHLFLAAVTEFLEARNVSKKLTTKCKMIENTILLQILYWLPIYSDLEVFKIQDPELL